MASDFSDRFWGLICHYEHLLQVLVALLTFFLVLSGASLFAVEPGSGTYLVVLLNFAIFTPSLVIVYVMLRKCRTR